MRRSALLKLATVVQYCQLCDENRPKLEKGGNKFEIELNSDT